MTEHSTRTTHPRLLVLTALLATLVVVLFTPSMALARSYEISSVDIDATVYEDGTLLVSESRTFEFSGAFNGVYWDIPEGYNTSNGQDVEVTIVSASVDASGELELSDSGSNDTYSVTQEGDVERLTIYSAHEDETVTFTIVYEATGIVTRWEDTGELYWKFVSDGWDVESQNVTCTLHLPVPDGESVVAEDNVRAWGHGPLDGEVSFDGDDIVFTVPGVGTEEYAEMRVTFPTSWIASAEETSGSQLEIILSEENEWAQEANFERLQARLIVVGVVLLGLGLPVLFIVIALRYRAKYDRDFAPKFQDSYFRDVPTDDHPAVLGAFYSNGEAGAKEFTATLMCLTDDGVLRLDRVRKTKKGVIREKAEEDYRITRLREVAPATDALGGSAKAAASIDRKTLDFLFSKVSDARNADGQSELFFSDIEAFANRDAQGYEDAYQDWKGTVEGKCTERFSGDDFKGYGKPTLAYLFLIDIFVGIIVPIVTLILDVSFVVALLQVALVVAAGAVMLAVDKHNRDVSHEGVEVLAKLEALKHWLTEFTHLDEAVPTDVVLWNRLLVMAVVLDVADKVIEQLKIAAPQLLEDPYLMPTYGWLYGMGPGPRRPPAQAFSNSFNSAHKVSHRALAASSDSSGGGGGGGFSGGGGGGHGGGGGGGAF